MACLGITSQGHDPPGKLTTEKEEWSESGVHLCGVTAAGHAGAHVSFNIGRRSGVGGSLPTRMRVRRGQAPCTCMGMDIDMESLFTGMRRMTRAADGSMRRIWMQGLKMPPHVVAVYGVRRAVRHLHGISNREQPKAD